MLYEHRVYTAKPGKLQPLIARFRDHTARIFTRLGVVNVGYWTNPAEADQLVYILGFENAAKRESFWAAMKEDSEWAKVKAESEKDGVLVERVVATVLVPTEFSAMK